MFGKKNPDGKSARSEVANRLLRLSDQTQDAGVREALASLESLVLSSPAGPAEHAGKTRLDRLLDDAPRILGGGNPRHTMDYLSLLQEAILSWQSAKDEDGGKRMGLLDFLSKDAREQKKDAQKIAKLKEELSYLRLKQHTLTASVEKAEKERAALLQKAKDEAPGSNAFRMAKVRYDTLDKQVKMDMFQFNAFSNIIETKANYVASLESRMNARALGKFIPDSPQTMVEDMDLANMEVQELVEKLNVMADDGRDAARERDDVFGQLQGESSSDFEETIRQMQKAESLLGATVATAPEQQPDSTVTAAPDSATAREEEK